MPINHDQFDYVKHAQSFTDEPFSIVFLDQNQKQIEIVKTQIQKNQHNLKQALTNLMLLKYIRVQSYLYHFQPKILAYAIEDDIDSGFTFENLMKIWHQQLNALIFNRQSKKLIEYYDHKYNRKTLRRIIRTIQICEEADAFCDDIGWIVVDHLKELSINQLKTILKPQNLNQNYDQIKNDLLGNLTKTDFKNTLTWILDLQLIQSQIQTQLLKYCKQNHIFESPQNQKIQKLFNNLMQTCTYYTNLNPTKE